MPWHQRLLHGLTRFLGKPFFRWARFQHWSLSGAMSVLSHFRRVPAFRFPLGLVVAVFLGISGCRQERSMSTVPDFTLPEVRGGSFHLRAERFPAILLAFLQALPDTLDTPSRQQV